MFAVLLRWTVLLLNLHSTSPPLPSEADDTGESRKGFGQLVPPISLICSTRARGSRRCRSPAGGKRKGQRRVERWGERNGRKGSGAKSRGKAVRTGLRGLCQWTLANDRIRMEEFLNAALAPKEERMPVIE